MNGNQSGYTTAEEFMKELEADPEYQARTREHNQRMSEIRRRRREEAAPLAADLQRLGWDVESAWGFLGCEDDYSAVWPVLVEHLQRPYSDWVREGIVRALTHVAALDIAWDALRDAFIKNGGHAPEGIGFALGNALGEIMDASVLPDVLELVVDRAYGTNREVMVHYLVEYRDRPEVRQVLESLVDDRDVGKHARRALTLRRVRRRPGRGRRRKR